jgi:hypothetical protein
MVSRTSDSLRQNRRPSFLAKVARGRSNGNCNGSDDNNNSTATAYQQDSQLTVSTNSVDDRKTKNLTTNVVVSDNNNSSRPSTRSGGRSRKIQVPFAYVGKYLLKKRRALEKQQQNEEEEEEEEGNMKNKNNHERQNNNKNKNTNNDDNDVNVDFNVNEGGGDNNNNNNNNNDNSNDEHDNDKLLSADDKPDTIERSASNNSSTGSNHLKNLSRKSMLAVPRTPSFNVMLRTNEYYRESSTLLKRSSMRITWDDLEEQNYNNNSLDINNNNSNSNGVGSNNNNNNNSVDGDDDQNSSNSINRNSDRSAGSMLQIRRKHSNDHTSSLCIKPSKSHRHHSDGLWSSTASIEFNPDFKKFVLTEKVKDWLKAFKTCDPRYKILKFFNDVANEGATGESINFKRDHVSPLLKFFNRSSVFTVWRPTSMDAIRRMMLGEGVGKGLDIKGKSAKCGKLSALVPFLQINKEEHKSKVRTLRKNSKIRIFFNTEKDRTTVVQNLNLLALELQQTVNESKQIVNANNNADENLHDEKAIETAMEKLTLDMDDPIIDIIDTYAATDGKYGIAVQERLFWEGMVTRQNITRKVGSDDYTGRTSMPSFQDMNFASLRAKSAGILGGGTTRAVIMQYRPPPPSTTSEGNNEQNEFGDDENDDDYDPMCPLNLVMAYEENDPDIQRFRIIPCVSDFDCFIVGSRGVKYEEQVPEEQLDILKWGVNQTEKILENEGTDSWTKRWLDVLKECGSKGFHANIPPGGYSDPKTRFIFEHAIQRLSATGSVRHGAECFNYYFPQELDDKLLVISDELPEQYNGRSWVYVDQDELKEILLAKIKLGYTFPLNPKWILCDPGWKNVYDQLMKSYHPNVQDSLQCWYPPESGTRERIENVYNKYPDGFQRLKNNANDNIKAFKIEPRRSTRLSYVDGTAAMDLAELELKYYLIFQRARRRLKAILMLKRMLDRIRKERSLEEEQQEAQQEENAVKGDLHHEDEEHESNNNKTVNSEE